MVFNVLDVGVCAMSQMQMFRVLSSREDALTQHHGIQTK